MTYVVLARKWRPQRFEDVVGQQHITNTLANAIAQGRVAHGYLFCGPRGVGKTTTARILAKALNCEKGPTPTPCNACSACHDVDLGRSMDIIEVDGASTRGIDDVRELRENVRYAPTGGGTKVYIIDEVHMLTREAFNALLKTLEEPPPHVVFVMATTEPFKVPATILSRCQRFDFARIHPREVAARLAAIVEAEGFQVEPDAVALLARRSQGGLRDALSALDQVLASADGPVTVRMINAVLGLLSSEFYFRLTDCLVAGDAPGALRMLDEIYHAGADLGEMAEELARHLRNIMLLSVGPDLEPVLAELGPAEVARVREQAARVQPGAAARLLEVSLRTLGQARRSEHLRLHLEMAMVELAAVSGAVSLGEVARRLEEMERRLGGGGSATGAPRPAAGRRPAARTESPAAGAGPDPEMGAAETGSAPGAAGGAAPEAGFRADLVSPGDETLADAWERVVAEVKGRRMSVGAFLIGSRVAGTDEQGQLIVQVDAGHQFFKTHLEEVGTRRFIEGIIREVLGRPVKYQVVVGEVGLPAASRAEAAGPPAAEDAAPRPGAAAAGAAGTAGEKPPADARPRKSPLEIAQTDPTAHRVMDLFDGEIIP